MSPAPEKTLSGRTVLFSLLSFFAVVIGMNIFMARSALQSFDGQVEEDAYRKGLTFNDKIDRARAEAALGWTANVTHSGSTLKVTLQDSQSLPVLGAQLTAALWHKTADGMDHALSVRQIGPGQYESDIADVRAGRWELRLIVKRGDESVRFRRDLKLIGAQAGAQTGAQTGAQANG